MIRDKHVRAFLVYAIRVVNSLAYKSEEQEPIAKIVAINPNALADVLLASEQEERGVENGEHRDNGHKPEAAPQRP